MGILPRHPKKRRAAIVAVMLVLLALVIFNRVLRAAVVGVEGVHAATLTVERADFAPTRLDLALAFIRLEQAYRDDPTLAQRVTPASNREANRLFDRATGEFFRGDTSRVPAMLARATSALLGERPHAAERRAALSRLRIATHDGLEGLAAYWPPRLILPDDLDATLLDAMTLTLHDPKTNNQLAELPLNANPAAANASGANSNDANSNDAGPNGAGSNGAGPTGGMGFQPVPAQLPITLEIRARTPAHADADADQDHGPTTTLLARFTLNADHHAESLAQTHAANAARIEALAEQQPPLSVHTLAALRYRNDLLLGGDWRPELTPIVVNLPQLRSELADDLRRAEQGEDPFQRRAGEHVRAIQHHTGPIPARVHAPARAGDDDTPRPVVIAFHGAGVDEHLWFLGYGGGQLQRLAEQHNFILIAPRAYTFMTDITRFDALLEAIAESYAIDPERITIIGHSMGGVLCTAIAQARPERVAAAVGIAGARWINPNQPIAPMRFYVPEFDPIVPPNNVRRPATQARDAGLPVQIIEVPDQGHTLVVPAVLDDAIAWMLEQRLGR